jgi:alpha 1,6-mannosyltransferase
MVDRALTGLGDVAQSQGVPLGEIELVNWDVLNTTGPIAWTEAVFEGIQKQKPEIKDLRDFSGLEEPTLYGDILVLPFESFQAEPLDEWGITFGRHRRTLVRHYFSSAWRIGARF